MLACGMREAVYPTAAASIFRTEMAAQIYDRCGRSGIQACGDLVAMIMAQIAADDDERFGTSPKAIQHRAYLPLVGLSDHQRYNRKFIQQVLEKRQLYLETVLPAVRGIQSLNERQVLQLAGKLIVDTDSAHRCFEYRSLRERKPMKRHLMRWPEQYHSFDGGRVPGDLCISAGRYRSRIDETGMRHNQRFWANSDRLGRFQILPDEMTKLARIVGVKQPRNRGPANLIIEYLRVHDV